MRRGSARRPKQHGTLVHASASQLCVTGSTGFRRVCPYPRQRIRRALADASALQETSDARHNLWFKASVSRSTAETRDEFGMRPSRSAAMCHAVRVRRGSWGREPASPKRDLRQLDECRELTEIDSVLLPSSGIVASGRSSTTSVCPTARWPKWRRQRAVSTDGS